MIVENRIKNYTKELNPVLKFLLYIKMQSPITFFSFIIAKSYSIQENMSLRNKIGHYTFLKRGNNNKNSVVFLCLI